MTQLYSAYHLSSTQKPSKESWGDKAGINASHAYQIFKYWKPHHQYLILVSYTNEQVIDSYEEGHHDEVSSICTSEFVTLDNVKHYQAWDLNNLESLRILSNTEFLSALHQGLFGEQHHLIKALAHWLKEDLASDILDRFKLSEHHLLDSIEVLSIQTIKTFLNTNLITEEQLARYYDQQLYLANLMWMLHKNGDNINDEKLIRLFDESHQPTEKKLRHAVARFRLISGLPWDFLVRQNEQLNINKDHFELLCQERSSKEIVNALFAKDSTIAIYNQ